LHLFVIYSFADYFIIRPFSEDFRVLTLRRYCSGARLNDIVITIRVEYGYYIIIIGMPMRTSEFKLTDIRKAFARKKVISKAELLQDCGCSAMTAWRLLRQVGYCRSYNHNARYFTLASTPEFDDHGLWTYQDIRFSKWGTLPETIIAVIEKSPGGMTAQELAEFLRVRNVKPLLTRLILNGRLWREALEGAFVYLTPEQSRHDQQMQHRRTEITVAPRLARLPEPPQIIALLVEMIRNPQQTPQHWARRLARNNVPLGTQDIRAVMEHYQLTVKKGLLNT